MGDDEDGPSRALVALLQPLCSDAWVQCDHCELWRRVPKEVSERLGDDEQWCVWVDRAVHRGCNEWGRRRCVDVGGKKQESLRG